LWNSPEVKVRTFDVRQPWRERGGRKVDDWWEVWEKKVKPGWYGNEHGGGNPERRRLWRDVLKPLVGS
jgi:hypothetical protein